MPQQKEFKMKNRDTTCATNPSATLERNPTAPESMAGLQDQPANIIKLQKTVFKRFELTSSIRGIKDLASAETLLSFGIVIFALRMPRLPAS